MRRFLVVAAACVAVLAGPGVADAGRTHYGWLYGAEVMPERGVEMQSWVAEENSKGGDEDIHDTSLWWGALVGITDRLELALPVEFLWREVDGEEPTFTMNRYGAELRYRFVTQDPVEAPPLAPLVRLAVKRDVTERERVRAEADVVVAYESGRFHALVDLGVVGKFSRDDASYEFRPGAGVSVAVGKDLRLGAEFYGEFRSRSTRYGWAVAGPNVAWTHGRFWLSAAFGIGVYQIDTAPRIVWGILF